jgi:hypothetical protein
VNGCLLWMSCSLWLDDGDEDLFPFMVFVVVGCFDDPDNEDSDSAKSTEDSLNDGDCCGLFSVFRRTSMDTC